LLLILDMISLLFFFENMSISYKLAFSLKLS
jgi:hypothetical protein